MTTRVKAQRRTAADACEPLIKLYQAMQDGWVPPRELTKDQWKAYKDTQDMSDPMTAFAGIGCSHRGLWFGSFAAKYKYTKRVVSAAEAAVNSLTNKMAKCSGVRFVHRDYASTPTSDLTYCDPPYAGTLGYGGVPGEWDPDAFWAWARERSRYEMVCISEMKAPSDFHPLLTFEIQSRIATQAGKRRVEYLYVHEDQRETWEEHTT